MMTVTKGRMPWRPPHHASECGGRAHADGTRGPLSEARRRYVFDKLSSVFASGNRTRDDQPNHIRVETRVRRPVAEAWQWMCPAHVYEVGADLGDGMVSVSVTPSNCVQCGAITAKGGRLTPPEGRLGARVHPHLRVLSGAC